ncbi:MAG: galactonate dehydratase [Alicyclobacillus macrosporangiidus]|uniref:galactonate dehydratase n=1 Tax=Alicyclobacillus macrosporangiidus TaxID=392015 RepID=UPI0026EE9B3B|nr:galactonate dehydratase [Alicyclobacillus macrosporangiidus]MCL6600453.1 galactonate dehydratase [Alicyclobacillus macrosporangiidus]
MKVARMELFLVPPRWLFLKLTTDDGLVGWGEPVVEGRAATVAAAVRELEEYVIGRDPNDIEDIWQVLYRGGFYRGGPVLMSAIAGIDQALWDIKGKRYGLPVYEFLGGRVRQRVRVYAWIGGDRPQDVGQAALEKKQAGFTAIKMNASEEMHYIDSHAKVEAIVARVAAVREACGKDFGIAVDFHGRLHKAMAKVVAKELEPFHLMFIEEPVLPENHEALREIARHTTVPIATGERMFSRWDFKRVFEQGGVDIIQPDLSHAGGISEVRKIGAMAEAYDVAVAPHCPLGPIALAASLQVDASLPNVFIQEQSLGIHYNETSDLLDYLVDRAVFAYRDGYADIPAGPGLGIAIDEEKVRAVAGDHRWRNPVWRNEDGTVAEW